MGRSRRRMKKGAPKVKVGLVKRRKDVKAKLPLEIREGRADVEKRLQQKPDWSETATLTANYGANKFVLNPNEGFGRNQNQRGRPPLKTPEERAAADGATFDDDDELRAATGKMRKSGKAAPQPLTATQQEVVRRLLDAHGEDVEAWFRDTKLNRMQHSVGKLKALLEAHKFYAAAGGAAAHGFRAARKPPKRIL